MGGLFTKKESTAYAPGDLAPPVTVEQRERDDPLTVVYTMPLRIAKVAGVVVAAFVLLAVLCVWSAWHEMPWQLVVFVPPASGLLVFGGVFWKLSPRRLLEKFEKRYNRDFNHDGYIGEPPAPPEPTHQSVDVHFDGGPGHRGGDFLDFPVKPSAAIKILNVAVRGKPTFAALRAAKVSDADATQMRDYLVGEGYAEYSNGRNAEEGWELLPLGRTKMIAYLRKYGNPPTPLPGE